VALLAIAFSILFRRDQQQAIDLPRWGAGEDQRMRNALSHLGVRQHFEARSVWSPGHLFPLSSNLGRARRIEAHIWTVREGRALGA
jgi:hypothetical protein